MASSASPRSILITGASRGLGAALAAHDAQPEVSLFLGGRDQTALSEVKATCVAKGATVEIAVVDVLEETKMRAWIERADQTRALDLVIANAGVSADTTAESDQTRQAKAVAGESQRLAQQVFAVNVYGVLNTLYPALGCMRPRGEGQIALMSSLAAFHGLPGAPSYCASKAAVRLFGEAWRAMLAHEGLKINVICPGYIKTTMTEANEFAMPLMMPPAKAAHIIARGLARNKARISFPWQMRFLIWLIATMPGAWRDRLLRQRKS